MTKTTTTPPYEFQDGKLAAVKGVPLSMIAASDLRNIVQVLAEDLILIGRERDGLRDDLDGVAATLGQSLLDNAALSRGFETYGWSMQFTCPATGRKGSPAITLDPEQARDMMGCNNWTVTELFTLKAPRPADPAPLAPETWEGSDAHPGGNYHG